MTKSKMTKQRLAEQASVLFRRNGYHRTSIQDIANACHLTKASIYHHITSKEALAQQIIEDQHAHLEKDVFSIAHDPQLSRADKSERFFIALEQHYEEHDGHCLMGKFILELDESNQALINTIQALTRDWIAALTALCGSETCAMKVLATLQGYLMLGRLYDEIPRLSSLKSMVVQEEPLTQA